MRFSNSTVFTLGVWVGGMVCGGIGPWLWSVIVLCGMTWFWYKPRHMSGHRCDCPMTNNWTNRRPTGEVEKGNDPLDRRDAVFDQDEWSDEDEEDLPVTSARSVTFANPLVR